MRTKAQNPQVVERIAGAALNPHGPVAHTCTIDEGYVENLDKS